RFSCAPPCTRCTRSTRRTAGPISAKRAGSAIATSRSVAPRSVPSRSRSRTTPSSRSRSGWWTRTTLPSRRCGGNSPASRSVSQSGPDASTQNQGESVAMAQSMIVSTTFDVQGRRVREYKGVVRGITVRAPTISQGILGGLKSIIGGQIGAYTEMCEQARQAAYDLMVEHGQQVGANAILGVSFDASEVAAQASATEVLCYGTAAVLEGARAPP